MLLLSHLLIGLNTRYLDLLKFNCNNLISSQLKNSNKYLLFPLKKTLVSFDCMTTSRDVNIVVMLLIYIRNSTGPRIECWVLQSASLKGQVYSYLCQQFGIGFVGNFFVSSNVITVIP